MEWKLENEETQKRSESTQTTSVLRETQKSRSNGWTTTTTHTPTRPLAIKGGGGEGTEERGIKDQGHDLLFHFTPLPTPLY